MYLRTNRYRNSTPPGWSAMDSAPRDGTIIEVQCNFGIAPWFGLYRWAETSWGEEFGWRKVGDENSGFTEGASFSWRPYVAESAAGYVDPTDGAQDTRNYWLRAAGHPPVPNGDLSFAEEDRMRAAAPLEIDIQEPGEEPARASFGVHAVVIALLAVPVLLLIAMVVSR